MSDDEKKPDYNVGYGKPPAHTRFKKGESGNPKGKPKGAKNLATLLDKTINERVLVTENGRRRSISKLEAAVKQLVNKAAGGDHRSIQQLLGLVQLVEQRNEATAPVEMAIPEADQIVMSNILERVRCTVSQSDD